MVRKPFFILFLLCAVFGCFKPPAIPTPLTDPEKRLVEICKNEYHLDVVLKRLSTTLWVYAPVAEDFFHLKVSDDGPKEAQPPTEAQTIHFLKGDYKDGVLKFRYDIALAKNGSEDAGYSMQFKESFNTYRRNLTTAIARAFGDAEKRAGKTGMYQKIAGDVDFVGGEKQGEHKSLVHSYVETDRLPDFFIVVLADIKNGVEAEMIFNLEDILRGMNDATFMEEYTRRVISKNPTGQTAIIGDVTGSHLNYHDITWEEFLTDQITSRIRFKYQQSSFPPGADAEKEIMQIIAVTFNAYRFDNFTSVILENLETAKRFTFDKAQVGTFAK